MTNMGAKYPDISDILQRKAEGRKEIASRTFGQKIAMVEAMRERLAPLKACVRKNRPSAKKLGPANPDRLPKFRLAEISVTYWVSAKRTQVAPHVNFIITRISASPSDASRRRAPAIHACRGRRPRRPPRRGERYIPAPGRALLR